MQRSMSKKSNYLTNTYKLLKLDSKDIVNIYFYAIAGGLISLGLPLGIQAIIGFVMASQLSTSMVLLIMVVVLATLFYGLFQINQLKIIEKMKQKIFIRFSLAFDEKLSKLDVQRNKEYQLSELMNRFFDTLTFQKSLSKLLIDIPTSTIQILLGLLLLTFYHPLFILFGIFLLVTLYLLLRFTGIRGMETSIQESNHKYELVDWIEQQADYIKDVRGGVFDDLKTSRTNEILHNYIHARTSHFKILNLQYWSLTLFKVVLTAVMLIVGSYLLIEQLINIGQFVASEIVIILLLSAIEKIIFGLDNAYDLLTSTKKLFTVLDLPEITGSQLMSSAKVQGTQLMGEQISLTSVDGKQILKNINFQLIQGDICCINGQSGSGKSSLLNLISGIYTSYNGRLTLDEIALNDANGLRSRDYIAVHYLEGGLVESTVLENICLQRAGCEISEVIQLAKEVGFHSEISALPNGYNTMVSANKANIPRQTQRMILLMRVLIRNVPIYIFEQPFAELTEKNIQQLVNYWQSHLSNKIVIYSTQSDHYEQFGTKLLTLHDGMVGYFGANTKK